MQSIPNLRPNLNMQSIPNMRPTLSLQPNLKMKSIPNLKSFFFIGLLLLSACTTIEKAHFYEVTSPQGEKGYLLGTMHIGVPVEDLPSKVLTQFENSDPVFVEVDLSSPALIQLETQSMIHAITEDLRNSKLMRVTPAGLEEARDRLEKYLNELAAGVQDSEVPTAAKIEKGNHSRFTEAEWNSISDVMYPIFGSERDIDELHIETISIFVSNYMKREVLVTRAKAQRLDPKWSMDLRLAKRAKDLGKQVQNLDSKESWPPQCMTEFFIDSTKQALHSTTEQLLKEQDLTEAAYRTGDPEKLKPYLTKHENKYLENCLLKDRNEYWYPKIQIKLRESIATKRVPFFAFGAAHLYGEHGVIEMLTKNGYYVRQIE